MTVSGTISQLSGIFMNVGGDLLRDQFAQLIRSIQAVWNVSSMEVGSDLLESMASVANIAHKVADLLKSIYNFGKTLVNLGISFTSLIGALSAALISSTSIPALIFLYYLGQLILKLNEDLSKSLIQTPEYLEKLNKNIKDLMIMAEESYQKQLEQAKCVSDITKLGAKNLFDKWEHLISMICGQAKDTAWSVKLFNQVFPEVTKCTRPRPLGGATK